MKKLFMVLGVIFLMLIVAGIVFVIIGQNARSKYDASSKSYINENIPAIISTWSKAELKKRESSELSKMVSDKDLDELFQNFVKLGSLKKYEIEKGASSIFVTTKDGKVITANYILNATFQNGEAEIKVGLIYKNGQWQILGFFVNSPFFLKAESSTWQLQSAPH